MDSLMILKIKKFFGIFSLFLLYGCGSADETNFDKIARFEMENAKAVMEESIIQAQSLAQENTDEIHLDDFRNYPILETYKKTHAELGLDVTKIPYVKDIQVSNLEKVNSYEAQQRTKLPEVSGSTRNH